MTPQEELALPISKGQKGFYISECNGSGSQTRVNSCEMGA